MVKMLFLDWNDRQSGVINTCSLVIAPDFIQCNYYKLPSILHLSTNSDNNYCFGLFAAMTYKAHMNNETVNSVKSGFQDAGFNK